MITRTRNCDGCGQKIESTNPDTLSNKTVDSRAELSKNGSLFFELGVRLCGQTESVGGNLNTLHYEQGEFEICTGCAETRTIASFKIKQPLA